MRGWFQSCCIYVLMLAVLLTGCTTVILGDDAEKGKDEHRTIIYEAFGVAFMNPFDTRMTEDGRAVKVAVDHSNIYLESSKGRVVPLLNQTDAPMAVSAESAGESGDQKAPLRAMNPHPVNQGRQIVFTSSLNEFGQFGSQHSLHMVNLDGTGESLLLPADKYGHVELIDTVGSWVYAQGSGHSLIAVNAATLETKRFDIQGHIDAVAEDGKHVLYRKVKDDYILPELYMFNMKTAASKEIGPSPADYFFNKQLN